MFQVGNDVNTYQMVWKFQIQLHKDFGPMVRIKELSADCIFNIAPILHNEIFDLKLEIHIIKYVCHLSTYLHSLI